MHIYLTLARFSHCQLQWTTCKRLLTPTESSTKCTLMPRMNGQAASQQIFSLSNPSRMRLHWKAVALWGIWVLLSAKLQSFYSPYTCDTQESLMKAIAHSYYWWNGLNQDIEKLASSCESCHVVKSSPAVAPLHPWAWPDAPWKCLHACGCSWSLPW